MTISHPNPLVGRPLDSRARIIRVDASRRVEAVERLVSSGPESGADHARRFLEFAREHQVDLRAMWSRLDERGRVRATVLAVPNPGRTAMVFATQARRPGETGPRGQLVDHACRTLPSLDDPFAAVQLAQVLVDPADLLDREVFLSGGFGELARLSYLERPLPGPRVPAPEWPPQVRLEPYREDRRAAMLAVLDASYRQTLDCPGLLGLRRTEDILAGHMATGEFDPSLWTILHLDERPAGVLLLNPSSQGKCIELVYLGLAEFARGRGLGRRLLGHGLRLVQRRRERFVMLAVDENNRPALNLYHREGFRRVLRRIALIRPLGESPQS